MAASFFPASVTRNDVVLFLSLLYSGLDILFDWDAFSGCYQPIHGWLLISYSTVITFRVIHLCGIHNQIGDDGDFLLNLRQKGKIAKFLISLTWLIAMPAFVLWTVLGTWWLWQTMTYTPTCLPEGAHTWFVFLWQGLSYVWIVVHLGLGASASLLEYRLRRAEGDMRQVSDADTIARWGEDAAYLPGYNSLSTSTSKTMGLRPSDIAALPGLTAWSGSTTREECDCPICLNNFEVGENVRTLCPCGHVFHRSCIDLWLLRNCVCPLCKQSIKVTPNAEKSEVNVGAEGARRRASA